MNESHATVGRNRLSVLGALTGAVTHELNNIFGILGLRLEKLSLELEGNQATERDLEVIQRNVDRAGSLIGRLQDFRAAAERPVSPVAGKINLAKTLQPAVDALTALYDRKLPLDVHFEDGLHAACVSEDLALFFMTAVQWLRRHIAPGSGVSVRLTQDRGVRLELSGQAAETETAETPAEVLRTLLDALAAHPDNGLGACELARSGDRVTINLRLE